MKKILSTLLLMVLFSALPTDSARASLICSRSILNQAVAVAKAHSDYDKNMHCSVSCQMSLRCPAPEVMIIGYLKEVKDLFGPGNAEVKDIVADRRGIWLVQTKRAKTIQGCLNQCDLYYTR